VLRNPYEAILSQHNFLYAGHHGKAPIANFERKGKNKQNFKRKLKITKILKEKIKISKI
jgi:hypothetical protein